MRFFASTVLVLTILPSFAISQESGKVAVSLQVVNANGTPGREAIADQLWHFMQYGPDNRFSQIPKEQRGKIRSPMAHPNELYAPGGIVADEDGRLTLSVEPADLPRTYFLMSQDHREGAIMVLKDIVSQQGSRIQLETLTNVKLDITRPLPEDTKRSSVQLSVIYTLTGSNVYFSLRDCSPKQSHVTAAFGVPTGRYKLCVQSDGCAVSGPEFVIEKDQVGQEVKLEAKLTPKFIRAYMGKTPPPLCTTGSVGAISRDAMDRHKGRPLLIVFFRAASCGPQEDLEKLFALYRELEQRQKDDRILIYCERDVRDEKDYRARVVDQIKREHKEIEFSAPVLLDGDLCTVKSWGIEIVGETPATAVLLDKDGRVVEQGSPWSLWSRVDSLAEKPSKSHP